MRHVTKHSPAADQRADSDQTRVLKLVALVVAATFIAVGIAGFIPGLTTDADELHFAGPHEGTDARPELLGLFHVSVLHNLVHLGFGAAGLALARSARGASGFLIGGGIIYAVLMVYGMVIDQSSDWNFVPVNDADNYLHGGLAAGMILLGLLLTPRRASVATTDSGQR